MNKHFCLDDSPEFRMVELDEVTSTNDFLRSYRPVGPERRITLVTAEYQTAGRGAGQNHWESQPGQNLLFSLLVHPRHIHPERMFVLSEVMALSIREALQSFISSPSCSSSLRKRLPTSPSASFTVKWPNDIYFGDRKLCGMLIENDLQGSQIERCVLGAGININQTEFAFDRTQQDGLRRMAEPISLAQIVGHEVERRFVLERVMELFTRYYSWTEQGRQDELHQMYLSQLYRRGELHTFRDKDGTFEGTIVDVEPTGHLIIVDEMGKNRRYAFKEVEHFLKG